VQNGAEFVVGGVQCRWWRRKDVRVRASGRSVVLSCLERNAGRAKSRTAAKRVTRVDELCMTFSDAVTFAWMAFLEAVTPCLSGKLRAHHRRTINHKRK
jgi:hypothetical protein